MNKKQDTQRLWDAEPSLWEAAQNAVIKRRLDAQNPQIEGFGFEPPGYNTTPGIGNQQMKVSLWGPSESITLSINKTDVWDRRKTWEKPVTLKEVREGAFSPANADKRPHPDMQDDHWCYMTPDGRLVNPYPGTRAYAFPCPKPVGQVIFRGEDFKDTPQPTAVTRCSDGSTAVSMKNGDAQADLTYLVTMEKGENIIVLKGSCKGLTKPVSVRLFRHTDTLRDGRYASPCYAGGSKWKLGGYDYKKDEDWYVPIDPPESGQDGEFFWIRQKLPAEKTFPGGFEYVLMGCVCGDGAHMEAVNGEKHLGTPAFGANDGSGETSIIFPHYEHIREAEGSAATVVFTQKPDVEFTVLLTVVTLCEVDDPMKEAKKRLQAAKKPGMEGLAAKNARWYKALYERREHGRIFKGDAEYISRYIPVLFKSWTFAQSQNTLPDPSRLEADAYIYGYMEQDTTPWNGLNCYNEIYMTSLSVINRSDRTGVYAGVVDWWRDAARRNAREVCGMPGMLLVHGYFPPIKPDAYPHSIVTFEYAMCTMAMVLKTMWDAWDYGGDEGLLKREVYPAMKDAADFFAAYARMEDDGFYHIEPTVAQERWALTYRFQYSRDATASLAMFRWVFTRAAEAARLLGIDEADAERWLSVSNRLAPYPTVEVSGETVLAAVPGDTNMDTRHDGHIAPVNLADEINLDSTPDLIRLALSTAKLTHRRDERMVYHLLGKDPERAYSYGFRDSAWENYILKANDGSLGKDEGIRSHRNKEYVWLVNEREKHDILWLEPERLLNSRSGRLHLFPCMPRGINAAFKDFQARGGFLVSAEYSQDEITYILIHSRRDAVCRFKNPWPGCGVRVVRLSDHSPEDTAPDPDCSDAYLFVARRGESYTVAACKK